MFPILVFMSLGPHTLSEQMYTIWKCWVPRWDVSNCFLSKYINAVCTCIYVNDRKAAGVLTKWDVMLWNTFTWLIGISERLCCRVATVTLIQARGDDLVGSLLFKQWKLAISNDRDTHKPNLLKRIFQTLVFYLK